MTNDPVSYSELLAALTAIVTLVSLGGAVWWKIHQRINSLNEKIDEVRRNSAAELSEFKLSVAKEYATMEAIKEVEERVVGAINRIGDRFDQYFTNTAPQRRKSPSG